VWCCSLAAVHGIIYFRDRLAFFHPTTNWANPLSNKKALTLGKSKKYIFPFFLSRKKQLMPFPLWL
jgi:hypothetical protein